MNDIIKIVESLEKSELLVKGVSEVNVISFLRML